MLKWHAVSAIIRSQLSRDRRNVLQDIASPIILIALYFIVFGTILGTHIKEIDSISYGAFIVPGLVMQAVITQTVSSASLCIFFPKFFGNIYEIYSAPISFAEIVIGYTVAMLIKALLLSSCILLICSLFIEIHIKHPFAMIVFLVSVCVLFSLLGLIIGFFAQTFEQLQIMPSLVITPLIFLGGAFYPTTMLPSAWQKSIMFNPIFHITSGFRWTFFELESSRIELSIVVIGLFIGLSLVIIWWMFRSGYRIKF